METCPLNGSPYVVCSSMLTYKKMLSTDGWWKKGDRVIKTILVHYKQATGLIDLTDDVNYIVLKRKKKSFLQVNTYLQMMNLGMFFKALLCSHHDTTKKKKRRTEVALIVKKDWM